MRYIYIGIIVAAVIIVGLLLTFNSNNTLEVDAFRDQADVAGFYRIILKNNGNNDINNIIIEFGNHNVTIPKLPAKQSIIVSPLKEVTSNYIIIRAEPNIFIEKEFRSAPRMPGMIGGMG